MVRRKIVAITGASGQLGRALSRILAPTCDVVSLSRPSIDIADWTAVRSAVISIRPHLVIHTAAATDVDGCEQDPENAFLVNSLGTRHVSQAAAMVGAPVVCLSTNYVFDGSKRSAYHEFDDVGPISVYGASKLAGEHEALCSSERCYVVRTAWLYAAEGRNFVTTMRRLMAERSELSVVNDQFGNPTFADDLAHAIVAITDQCPFGTYHVVNDGTATWFDWAMEIRDTTNSRADIIPIPASAYPRAATPPQNGAMQSLSLSSAGIVLRDWRDALRNCLAT